MATVTIVGINANTYSFAEGALFANAQTTVTTVYGGYSGSCTGTNNTTCDSCAAIADETPPIPACNTKRIYDALFLEVTIQIDGDAGQTGQILITEQVGTEAAVPAILHQPTDLQNVGVGGQVVVRIPWEKLCDYLSGLTSGCAEGTVANSTPKPIRIGIDFIPTDNVLDDFTADLQVVMAKLDAGVGANTLCLSGSGTFNAACNFTTYPGDGKVYIENVRTSCSFPDLTDALDAQAVRIYYREASEGIPNQKNGQFVDLPVATSAATTTCPSGSSAKVIGVTNNEVTGLTNDTDYLFSVGIIDKAGNLGYVTNDGNAGSADTSKCFEPAETSGRNCHRATPSKVAGLLTDELDCFITTAAYGSPFQEKVKTFRLFRNRFLKTNGLGRFIIKNYYHYSPPLARWIDAHPNSRPVARAVLWPFWLVARLVLHWPLTMALMTLMALALIVRPRQRPGDSK